MGARQKVLREIFKKGVNNFSKEELDDLFRKMSKKKIYRYDRKPEELMEEGFNLNRTGNYDVDISEFDIPGLYFGKTKRDVRINVDEDMPLKDINIEALMHPDSNLQRVNIPTLRPEGWEHPPAYEDIDIIDRYFKYPNMPKNTPVSREYIQLKPGRSLARTKDKEGNWLYRIIGLLGALQAAEENK